MRTIVVVDYDPTWPATFERLRSAIWPVVSDIASAIEHVGSTAVPGLAAKPVIDLTIIVPTKTDAKASPSRVTLPFATICECTRKQHGSTAGSSGSRPGFRTT